jgi:hypothetical protein
MPNRRFQQDATGNYISEVYVCWLEARLNEAREIIERKDNGFEDVVTEWREATKDVP